MSTWDGSIEESFSTTDGNSITITSAAELALLAKNVNEGNTYSGYTITLGIDIDLDNHEWTPIGNSSKNFNGTFDGDNHTISGLTINSTNYCIGLFGAVGTGGMIQNVNIDGANVVSSDNDDVAAVAGLNFGTIQNCTVTNSVIIGLRYVGAIVGYNSSGGIVTGNTVSAQVAGQNNVGAVVGYNINEYTSGDGSYHRDTGTVTNNTFTSNVSEAVGHNETNGGIAGIVENNTSTGTLPDPEIPDDLFSGNDEPDNPQPTYNVQFVKNGNNVQLVDNDGNVLLELAGAKNLTVDDNIYEGNEIDLFVTNFAGNKISVVSNAGGFNFYFSEYNNNGGYVGSLSGKTFVGNGDNIAVEADGVTVDVSKGNNTIELGSYVNRLSLTGFGAGDAIKLADWRQDCRIAGIQQNIDGTVTVNITTAWEEELNVSINGLNAANVSPSVGEYTTLDNGSVSVYKLNVTEAGAVFDGEKIVNVTEGFMYEFLDSETQETLFNVSGMKDNATFHRVDSKGLFLNAQDFTSNVIVNNNAVGYDIVLEGELSADIDSATFTATDGNDFIQNLGVSNLKIYGGKGVDQFVVVSGANETIMDYEADDRITVPILGLIAGAEVSGNDVIFRMSNGGKFTVKDGAKLGEITIYDWGDNDKTFEFEANEFNNDDPSKATSAVVNNDFADFGTGQFEKMYQITSAQEDAMIVGNANNNTIVVTGGSDNILIGGLGKDTYSFNDGGGIITDYGIGATKLGNGTALATSTTATNFDRTDSTSYAGEVDVVKVQGKVTGIYFERNNTTTKKTATFTATITYTDGDGNNELIVLKDIVKKPTKTGSSPIYQTNDIAAATLKIWDTSGSKQAVLSAAKLKKLFKDDDYLSAEQQEQADYLYELAERENIVVTTQDEESTFINPQIVAAMSKPGEDEVI